LERAGTTLAAFEGARL